MENIPDPDIEELKNIVKRQGQVIEDTNRMLHGMRRGQRLRTLWSVLWWLAIIGLSAGAYYYAQPYVSSIVTAYQSAQHGVQQAQSFPQLIGDYFKHVFEQLSGATTTAQ